MKHLARDRRDIFLHGAVGNGGIAEAAGWCFVSEQETSRVWMEMIRIRIVRAPMGEAPQWVRDAWIGLEMPASSRQQYRGLGVLTAGYWAALWKQLTGNTVNVDGYAVVYRDALHVLRPTNVAAADWWEANAHSWLKRGTLVFDRDACEEIHQRFGELSSVHRTDLRS